MSRGCLYDDNSNNCTSRVAKSFLDSSLDYPPQAEVECVCASLVDGKESYRNSSPGKF